MNLYLMSLFAYIFMVSPGFSATSPIPAIKPIEQAIKEIMQKLKLNSSNTSDNTGEITSTKAKKN